MEIKNILVTGGNGFLGKYICRDLIEKGFNVTTFHRKKGDFKDQLGVTEILGDITKIDDIRSALSNIDAVIHTASKVGMWGKYDDFFQINFIGTANLIKCMKEKKIKYLVYTSTPSVVFGNTDLIKVNESAPYPKKYLNHYAQTKAIAEQLVLKENSSDFKTVSLRPHLIFGKGDLNLIPRVLKAFDEKRLKIIGSGENLVDVSYVENVSELHVLALMKLIDGNKIDGKPYFIGQGPIKLWDFTNAILKKFNRPPLKTKIPLSLAFSIGLFLELILRLLQKYDLEPAMTRFVALQLGKSHYFDHSNLLNDFNYQYKYTIDEGIEKLN